MYVHMYGGVFCNVWVCVRVGSVIQVCVCVGVLETVWVFW